MSRSLGIIGNDRGHNNYCLIIYENDCDLNKHTNI